MAQADTLIFEVRFTSFKGFHQQNLGLKNFGKIIRICIANGWISQNPFANYKPKVKEVERAFLDESEIGAVANKDQ